MKKIISLFLSIIMLTTVFQGVSFSAYADDSEMKAVAAGSDVYKSYYYLNYSNYDYFVNDYRSVYQTNIENLANNKPYQALLTAWRVATFNISSEVDYSNKEIGYYETLLFDLLYDEESETMFQSFMTEYSSLTDSTESVYKALSASTFKKVADLYGAIGGDTPITDSSVAEAYKIMQSCGTISEACKLMGDVTDLIDYASTFNDLVINLCKVQTVLDSTNEINSILNDISSKCTDNYALKIAIEEFKGFTDDSISKSEAIAIFTGETLVGEGIKAITKKIYSSVVKSANLYGLAVSAGQAVGKFAANSLFGTSSAVDSYYELCTVFKFETLLRNEVKALGNNANGTTNASVAKKFNTSVVMLCKTYIAGIETYKKFVEKNYHNGTLGDYINGLSDEDYVTLMNSADELIDSIDKSISFNESVSMTIYKEKLEEYADEINNIQINTVSTGISNESYQKSVSVTKTISTSFSGVINKSLSLSSDMFMYGDVCISSSVDLNGYSLTIKGTLNHTYGDLRLNGGELNITGDYIGAVISTNSSGEKTYSYNGSNSGNYHNLYMTNEYDQMNVGGNFIECENNNMTKGTLEIGGSIESYNGFAFGTDHKTILKGEENQTIKLTSGSYLGQLEIENADSRVFTCENYFGCQKLLSNMTIIPKELNITKLDVNGKNVTVNGGLQNVSGVNLNCGTFDVSGGAVITNDFNLAGGTASFKGTLNHTGGNLTLNNGTLNILGDYVGAVVSTNSNGEKSYESTSGTLCMTNEYDQMNVTGDHIEYGNTPKMSNGILKVGGNLEIYGYTNFGEGHRIVLNGVEKQTIKFPGALYCGIIELTKDESNYLFEPSDSYKNIIIADCSHDYTHKILEDSTCMNDGLEILTCKICGKSFESIIPAADHDLSAKNIYPTCMQSGYTIYTCSVCGYSYKSDYTELGEHTYTSTVTKQASCLQTGRVIYTCSVCGDSYAEIIPMTEHNYESIVINPTADKRGYTNHICSICGDSYIDSYTDFVNDTDTLSAAVEKFSEFNSADYSIESYNNLKDIVDRNKEFIDIAQSQQEIDNAVTEILEAIYDLEPYLNLTVTAPNGTFTVAYDEETNSNNGNSLLFGTNVTVTATANEGYEFVGWYDTINNLYFSKNAEYSFKITTNTNLKAVFVKEQSATLTFTTYSNWVQSTVTKTIDEWNSVTSIDNLLPEVPYKYGYSNGRWVYDNADVLAKLQTGENVSLIPEYDEDDTSLPTPPSPDGDTPVLDLYYKLDADANVGSFVMAAGIPEDCQLESVGIAFYYKNADEFDPTKFELLINNKMLAGRFNTDEIEDIYIVNMNKMSADKNWAARGYVTYYDSDGNLKTVYSNQINIVNREQV